MQTLNKILLLLSGKKTTIISILALFTTTLLTQGLINENWAYFINGTLVILSGGANIMTNKMYKEMTPTQYKNQQ